MSDKTDSHSYSEWLSVPQHSEACHDVSSWRNVRVGRSLDKGGYG